MGGQTAGNLKLCKTGPNPARVRIRAYLADQLSSNFCETLGYENASKYLSNDIPKIELKDQLELLLSSKRSKENPFTQLQGNLAALLVFGVATCTTCLIMITTDVLSCFVSLTPLWIVN